MPAQRSLPSWSTSPPLPLGWDDTREVQNQLISLGFDSGLADGQAGPAAITAAQQYDKSRNGTGRVSIDSALLARLKEDPSPRPTHDPVAVRSQARQQARTSAAATAPASDQFGNIMQQIAPLIAAVISNANANNNRGYEPGHHGPTPGDYAPGSGYCASGYGVDWLSRALAAIRARR